MATPRKDTKHGKPTYNQAQTVVRLFGGERRLASLLGVARITPYRWSYKKPLGTDGLIPHRYWSKIRQLARGEGVLIRPEHLIPQELIYGNGDYNTFPRHFKAPTPFVQPPPKNARAAWRLKRKELKLLQEILG